MRKFREYDIWKDGIDLVNEVYAIADTLPKSEVFNLSSQLCRATVSIPSNIAEGASRKSEKDFARFIEIALGSAFEIETQIVICLNRSFIDQNQYETIINKITHLQKRLNGFRNSLLR